MRTSFWALLPILGGCAIAPTMLGTNTSSWYEVSPVLKPHDKMMDVIRSAVHSAGMGDLTETEPGYYLTPWRVYLSTHWREGYRSKLEVEVTSLPRGFCVRVRGYREVNNNSKNPARLEDADWIGAYLEEKQKDRVGEEAMRIHQILKLKLLEN